MSLLAASRIPNLIAFALQALGPLPSSSYTLKIIDQAGKDWKTVSSDEALALAAKNQIVGKGSESKLKYAQLTVDPSEAQLVIDEANCPPVARKRNILQSIPIADASFTVKHVNEATGQWWEHRDHICATYSQFASAGRAD